MQAAVLTSTRDMNREEWLKWRTKGIGGSDAAAIVGMNPWKSPVAVYLEKVGQAPEQEENEKMYWGTVLEDIVANEFQLRTGLKIRRRNAILQHPEHPFMLANVDRLIVGQNTGLECKTTSEYAKQDWEGEEVPASYLLQAQHYMAVTGYDAWWFAVLIGGNKFVYKKIDRDDELIDMLIQQEKDFWENHVLAQVPPAFDGTPSSDELLSYLYPSAEPDSEVELPDEADTLIEGLEQVKTEIKELETKKKEYENQLKGMLGEHERGVAGDRTVIWKTIESMRFDTKRFKKEKPELFEKYAKPSKYRRFQIS